MAKKVLLLVEDSPVDASIIADIVRKDGFEIYVAKTAEEGYERAVEVKPDLILLDLILPDGNGYDLCERLRRDKRIGEKALIVIVSVKNDMKDIEKAFAVGADDYVIKPPSPEFLLKKIKLYLRSEKAQ